MDNQLERPSLTEEVNSSRRRYKIILPHCFGKHVVDFGCGIGLNSFLLSHYCRLVDGYDISSEAIDEARENFQRGNLRFAHDLTHIDWESVEIVVSIEVIEHLAVTELPRTLYILSKVCDNFIGTTPNGDLVPYHPKDASEYFGHHKWHYTHDELVQLFSGYYKYVSVAGCVYDPEIKQFNTYKVTASNSIDWEDEWLEKVRLGE